MTTVTGTTDKPRTAAATRARQQARARRLIADLATNLDLIDTPALAAFIVDGFVEIRRRKTTRTGDGHRPL